VPDVVVEIIENPVYVTIDKEITYVDAGDQTVSVELGTSGPQGPKGDPGEVRYTDLSYVHDQAVASSIWTINHGLQFVPSITVVDSSGNVVEGFYSYPNSNTVVLNFSSPFAGKAYLS
jgi:hypothetical protein